MAGSRIFRTQNLVLATLTLVATPAFAAATLSLAVNEKPYAANAAAVPVKLNDTVTIEIDIKDGKAAKLIQLPHIDGVISNGRGGAPQPHMDNNFFYLTLTRLGPVTISPADIRTTDGQMLHVGAIRLTVVK